MKTHTSVWKFGCGLLLCLLGLQGARAQKQDVELDATAIDFHSLFVGKNELFPDNVHPSDYIGTYTIPVFANLTYKIYCAGSKMGFYGFTFEGRNDAEVTNITFADEKVKIMVRETICENPNRINPSQVKTESEYDNGKQRYDTLPTTSFSHQFVKKLYGLGLNDHQINIISSIIHSNKNKGDRKNTVCNYLTQSFGQKRGLKIYNAIKFIII